MNRADVSLGASVAIVGLAALVLSLRMPFYADSIPGPGFLPSLISGGLVVMGLLLAWQSLRPTGPEVRAIGAVSAVEKRTHGKPAPKEESSKFLPKRTLAVFAGYVMTVPLLPLIGFVLTGMALIAYLLLVVEKRRNLPSAAAVVLVPIAIYVLFVQLLGIELPSGMMGLGLLGI